MSSDPKPVGGQWHKAARGELSPPKGASEETLVPQLFTASVPDPRTVQIGSGGPDSNKRAQPGALHCFFQEEQLAPRDWTILGDGPERRNTLTIPLGSSTIRERLDHFCPIVKEDAMAAVAAIESTWTAFRFYCPCECAPESGSCDVFTVREALDLVGRAIEEYAYYAPNMWVESGTMLDDATLELTHCAMDNIVLTLMSGPLGVRPHYLFGDLVINAEAIVDVFNAKTIDPEDLSKTMLWSEVRTKAGANLFLTKAMQPLVPNVPQFQFAVAKDLLDEWFASIEGVQEFFDEQTLSACAISPRLGEITF